MAKRKKKSVARSARVVSSSSRRGNRVIAIVALLLNLLILPGLGSLIGSRFREGTWQVILSVIGFILFFSYPGVINLGTPVLFVAWVWGIITGVILLQKSR